MYETNILPTQQIYATTFNINATYQGKLIRYDNNISKAATKTRMQKTVTSLGIDLCFKCDLLFDGLAL
jgi:hypothetical protein